MWLLHTKLKPDIPDALGSPTSHQLNNVHSFMCVLENTTMGCPNPVQIQTKLKSPYTRLNNIPYSFSNDPHERMHTAWQCYVSNCYQKNHSTSRGGNNHPIVVLFSLQAWHLEWIMVSDPSTWHTLTLEGQCKPHGLGINLGESCSKLLRHCTKWGF